MKATHLLVGALLLAACSPAASGPPPLEVEDFAMAGVPPDADSAEIRLSFGDPDSAVLAQNPYDAYSPILSWYYRDFVVLFEGSAVPTGFLLMSPGERTLRGVQVGDPAQRVLELYGAPTFRYDPVWTYADPLEPEHGYILEFLVEGDTVSRIHLGRGAH